MANNPAFDQAVKDVADELRDNPGGAFALAVRIQANDGHNAEKLMQAAAALVKAGPKRSSDAQPLVDVEFPTAEAMQASLLEACEAEGGLGPDTMVLVPHLVQLIVEDRQRILTRLGAL